MKNTARIAMISVLLLGLLPDQAKAGVNKTGWYFPIPFTMASPQSPHRFGGVELGYGFGDGGHAIAFPLISNLTDRANRFIVEMSLPLSTTISQNGDSSFYISSPRLGLRGTWKFNMPFAEGYTFPAAWSVGADLNIPLTFFWGGNGASRRTVAMYPQDPVAWIPSWGYRPKAQLAIGKPLFFTEFELSLPNVVGHGGGYGFLLGWGLTLGTMPDDLISLTLEFGGMHDLTDNVFSRGRSALWGALGARMYFGQFVTGLAIRLPFNRSYVLAQSDGSLIDLDPTVAFILFIGYEIRHPERF